MSAVLNFYVLKTLQIIWIDLLLSGDNAVVIALACRRLPADRRRTAVILGATAAVVLRVVFAALVFSLLSLPWLKVIGGALLVWIAVKLLLGNHQDEKVSAASSMWGAVRTIAVADALMSLDNVLAITAAAHGNIWLILFGLALSVPLIVFGATLVIRLLDRFVWLLWAGAALLGWVAGEMVASDPALAGHVRSLSPYGEWWGGAIGAVLVIAIAATLKRFARAKRTS